MKQSETPPVYWQVNTLNAAQRWLIGRQGQVSLRLLPAAGSDHEALERSGSDCGIAPKGALCTIVGPAKLQIGVKGKLAEVEATVGEKAEIHVISTRIRCDDR